MSEPVLRRAVRAEWGLLFRTLWSGLRARKLAAIPMTVAAVLLTSLFQIVQNQSWGYQFVQNIGSVQADEHLWLALLRTPLSLFVPALDLPVWGALAQILLVFGVCEICLGRARTLLIAYAATLAGTMYARIGIWLGPDNPIGLPPTDAFVHDTGPSAAVVGLGIFVCWVYRAWFTCALVVLSMVYEVVFIKNNLAGREHIAAVVVLLVLCGVWEVLHRRKPRGEQRARAGV